ncbi:hypothetical protein DSO57_1014409 [Entomophthora muscae]|uniref:Uncharacterized protein n=1 Tax=Entomophthora muscae TaxID=34485 RepID=A0ACC2UF98_9FUNG|nr:hypothetical protein DSO57_1014409 [Entomophthora muscae]
MGLFSLLSTVFSSQAIVDPTEGHLESGSLSSFGPQTKGEYYYFVAELQGGSTPASVAQGLSAEFVRQGTPGNKYLFRKFKPANVTNHTMRDQVSLEYNAPRLIENTSTPGSVQMPSQIRSLEVYSQKERTQSLFRRDSSLNTYYEETVKKLTFKDPGFKYQWHLV